MLVWMLRCLFLVMIVAVLILNLSVEEIAGEAGRRNFYVILISGAVFAALAFLVDLFTP